MKRFEIRKDSNAAYNEKVANVINIQTFISYPFFVDIKKKNISQRP